MNHHKVLSEEFFAQAEQLDSDARKRYKPEIDDSSYQALKQKAETADNKVSVCKRELEELKTAGRSLRKEERQSSNTAHLRESIGKDIAENKRHSERKRKELDKLQAEARKAHRNKENAREELDSLAESNRAQRSESAAVKPRAVNELLDRASKEFQSQMDHAERAKEAEQSVRFGKSFRRRITRVVPDFIVPAFSIDEELSETIVSDMFSQLNRRGRRLERYDLLNAHVSLQRVPLKKITREFEARLDNQGLLWDRAREDVMRIMLINVHPNSEFTLSDDNYEALFPGRSFNIGSGNSIVPIKDADDFQDHWTRAQQIYEEGLDTIRSESSYGRALTETRNPKNFVPFEGILPVYCSLLTEASDDDAWERRVHQWYWACVLTERYISAQDS